MKNGADIKVQVAKFVGPGFNSMPRGNCGRRIEWWCIWSSHVRTVVRECDYCKKLNSLKHLVRTTVAELHN